MNYSFSKNMKTKKTIVIITLLTIASIFIIGVDWASKPVKILFHSYFADIAIPFGYYLLLVPVADKHNLFQKWYTKAGAVFILCALSETLQYFGIYALASIFDPLDYVMYALGVILAAFVDRILFKRIFDFWD
jgi:hypothetical protein